MTWARTLEEAASLLCSLARLAQCGYPVVVADCGECADFTNGIRNIPGVRVIVSGAIGPAGQMKVSLAAAADFATRRLLYVEPDKGHFFEGRLRDFVERAPDEDNIGVVLASRSASSLDTFPPMQRYTESVFNQLCGSIIGTPGDYTYGPFLMHRKLLPHIAAVTPELGWGWRPSLFVAARRQGLRVIHVVDDHPCPSDQRHEDGDDRRHRMRQLSDNIRGLIA